MITQFFQDHNRHFRLSVTKSIKSKILSFLGSWEGERMVLNFKKRQIWRLVEKMYAFFYINGPTYISQHSVKRRFTYISIKDLLDSFKNLIPFQNKYFFGRLPIWWSRTILTVEYKCLFMVGLFSHLSIYNSIFLEAKIDLFVFIYRVYR